ncbi:MAG TPA: hypothetical protein VF257_04185 [Solirubrobacteraceae bacterium]
MVEPELVSARDLAVADRIARAVRRGRPADRRPTLDQLLTAFGAPEPTLDARRRAGRALALAGVATVPDLLEAQPGQRVLLEVRSGKRHPVLRGLVAFVAVFGAGAALASTLDTSSTERASDLPPWTERTAAPSPTQTTAPAATTPGGAEPETTSSAPTPTPDHRAADRRARERRARERRAAAARAARRRVTVRLSATRPTFLCVEGDGRQLFNGTLTGSRSFRARVIRLNVGLQTTRVTANGKAVPLRRSPAGLEITARRRTDLGAARPCA